MSRIFGSAEQLIGGTPLLELGNIEKEEELEARLVAKLEYLNPAGSVKDRVALAMILEGEERGILKPGSTIIEPTSGNTGIGLAAVSAVRGYRVITVTTDEACAAGRRMAKREGILAGISSGAALHAATQLAKRPENAGKTIVVLLPDPGDRYLSTAMFTE